MASFNVLVKLLPSSRTLSPLPLFLHWRSSLPFCLLFLFPASSISQAMLEVSISFGNLDFIQVATCSTAGSTFGLVTCIFKVSIFCTFPRLFVVFSQPCSLLWLYLFSILSFLIFFCNRCRDFSLTREPKTLSDYRRLRLLSLEACLFLYCPHSTTLSFRLQFPNFSIPFTGFGFFSNLIERLQRDSSQLLRFSSRSMSGFLFPYAGFSVFSFHMPILVYTVQCSCFLVLFMRSQCMNLLYLHAAIPVGFFKVRVIISCCIFMSEPLFGLCFR